MTETQTRGWVAEEAERAERILALCLERQHASVDDVSELVASVRDLTREITRLHGVAHVGGRRTGSTSQPKFPPAPTRWVHCGQVWDLDVPYIDGSGRGWAHRGDWQYDTPLMWPVDATGDPEFLGDLVSRDEIARWAGDSRG